MFPSGAFERILQVNLAGTFRCLVHSAAGMMSLEPHPCGERGVIINTASIAAEDGQAGQAAYAASKGGVAAMTLPNARDLMVEGIRVSAVMPGLFKTPLLESLPSAAIEALEAQVPFPKRLGEPNEYASLVLEIIRNQYFNGTAIRLDGGVRMGA